MTTAGVQGADFGIEIMDQQHYDTQTGKLPIGPLDLAQEQRERATSCTETEIVTSASRRKKQSLSSIESSSSSRSSGSPLVHGGGGGRGSLLTRAHFASPGSLYDNAGNKCGKCQNHEMERSKKGHARDCPFKKCDCLKCRLLDARSDILQVISGKETKLKGTKKDPNCGFCQNHGVKILRKGHVRSCGYGQERHFRLDNCFSCEVHYVRNEVNRLQIKMRRAMKEDRMLSEEQRKTAREPITRHEVEKVCEMARLARRKREALASALVPEPALELEPCPAHCSYSPTAAPVPLVTVKEEPQQHFDDHDHLQHQHQHQQHPGPGGVWRPWSQQQIVASMAARTQQPQLGHHPRRRQQQQRQSQQQLQQLNNQQQQQHQQIQQHNIQPHQQQHHHIQIQLQPVNLQFDSSQLSRRAPLTPPPPPSPPPPQPMAPQALPLALMPPQQHQQLLPLQQQAPHQMGPAQAQQVFNTLFRLLVVQFQQQQQQNQRDHEQQ